MSTRPKVKNAQENSTDIPREVQKQLGENGVCRRQVNGGELFQQGPPKPSAQLHCPAFKGQVGEVKEPIVLHVFRVHH